jgi:hypothetical protein
MPLRPSRILQEVTWDWTLGSTVRLQYRGTECLCLALKWAEETSGCVVWNRQYWLIIELPRTSISVHKWKESTVACRTLRGEYLSLKSCHT